MSVVHLGVCREILIRLPAASLLRFRAVCKQWRTVIDDPCFAKSHIDNQHSSSNSIIIRNWVGPPFYPLYFFNLEDLDFRNAQQTIPATPLPLSRRGLTRIRSLPVSACNGLNLLVTKHEKTGEVSLEIWNALTGERLKLPLDRNTINFKVLGIGLGYDCVADDYKVVVIDYDGKSLRRTHVYSLKLDSWRMVRDCPYGFESRDIQHGSFLNGSLHWVSSDGIIIAYDLVTENYCQLALPVFQKAPISMELDALGGCLFLSYIGEDCIDRIFYEDNQKYFDAWVMNEYGVDDSWIKLFSLKDNYFSFSRNNIRSVAYMKSKNRVLVQYHDSFIWFDVGIESIKLVEVHGFCSKNGRWSDKKIAAQICIGSLFRLRDNCGRVASEIRTMKRGAIKKADTKLTFCVRDYEPIAHRKNAPASHADCYNLDSNWLTYSCQGDEIRTVSSDPGSNSFIHLDICREIFLHLPAKSLIRFRAVCKAYQAIIDEPCFVKAHTNNQPFANTILIQNSSGPPFYPLYSFDVDAINCTNKLERIPTTPLGFTHIGLSYQSTSVCNGLILIADKKWEMWNPLTNECLQLPRREFNSEFLATGFGYDFTTDDYKVVVIDRCSRLEDVNFVYQSHVYSLRSDSWRIIGNFPFDKFFFSKIPGVYLAGALHWTSYGLNKIIALDLKTEKYSHLQWPPLRSLRSYKVDEYKSLQVLGGCLVIIHVGVDNDNDDDYVDVWVMKEYGAEDSWINVFSIAREYFGSFEDIRPIAFTKYDSQVLLQDFDDFVLFDAENDCLHKLNTHVLRSSYAHAFSGSIFRLHDNCGVSGSGSFRTKRTRISKRQTEISDTELYLCVGVGRRLDRPDSHEVCHILDPNWCYLSSEDEDGD